MWLSSFSRAHFVTTRKYPKTYRRYLGTIFLGRVRPPQAPVRQELAPKKTMKKWKSAKKNGILLGRNPGFSAKRGDF
jgi:hypothetical protein